MMRYYKTTHDGTLVEVTDMTAGKWDDPPSLDLRRPQDVKAVPAWLQEQRDKLTFKRR